MKCLQATLFLLFFINITLTAIRGQGAYLNGKKIRVSETKTLKNAVVTTGCGAELPENYVTEFNNRMYTYTFKIN